MLLPRPRTKSRALFHAHFSEFTRSFNHCSTPQTISTRLFLQHRCRGVVSSSSEHTHSGHKHTQHRTAIDRETLYSAAASCPFPVPQPHHPCVPSSTECGSVLRNVPLSNGHNLPKAGFTRSIRNTHVSRDDYHRRGQTTANPKPIFSVLCNFCTHTPGAWFYGGVQRRSLLEEKNVTDQQLLALH